MGPFLSVTFLQKVNPYVSTGDALLKTHTEIDTISCQQSASETRAGMLDGTSE